MRWGRGVDRPGGSVVVDEESQLKSRSKSTTRISIYRCITLDYFSLLSTAQAQTKTTLAV